MAVKVRAEERARSIIRDLIAYYFHYGDRAAGEIENQLQTLSSLDSRKGETWRELMERWSWINGDMPVYADVLPDGLPADDSLCIVVLGFGLKENGAMKQELLDRLEVALRSAEKYPEAYVLCTGGETSRVAGVTEAGQMGAWLLQKGLPHNRLILEEEALSTTSNAQNSCRILWRDYPQVSSIAIVSSDYHLRWGSSCFNAVTLLGEGEQGEKRLEIVGNAGCATDTPDRDSMYSQAWGVCIVADLPFDPDYVPELYMPEEIPETRPAPAKMESSEPVQEVSGESFSGAGILPIAAAAALLFLLLKKKKTSGSD